MFGVCWILQIKSSFAMWVVTFTEPLWCMMWPFFVRYAGALKCQLYNITCWSVSYHVVINMWSFLINSCSEFSRTLNEMEPQARMQPCLKSVFIWLNTKVPPHVCLASNVISAPPPPKKIKPMFMQVLLLDQRLFRFFFFWKCIPVFSPFN